MANESKWAPVYDSDRREVTPSSLNELENVGIVFNTYRIEKGQVLTFDKNPQIVKQAPRIEGQRPTYLVACKRNGVKSWFNPSFLLTMNSDLQPVYPAWSALGGAKAVVEKLIEMGSIKGGENFKVKMTKFNRDGSRAEEVVRDGEGNIVLNEDQTPKMVYSTIDRDYPEIADPKA